MRSFILSAIISVKGTKVINATSLVMNIELMKHIPTRTAAIPPIPWTFDRSVRATRSNIPIERNPDTTAIRQNRIARVLKAI